MVSPVSASGFVVHRLDDDGLDQRLGARRRPRRRPGPHRRRRGLPAPRPRAGWTAGGRRQRAARCSARCSCAPRSTSRTGTCARSPSASPRSRRARRPRALGVGLKWPNDLVVGDRKLGGILAETDGREDDDGTTAVVVGLGLNVTWPGPPEANGTSLEVAVGPRRHARRSSWTRTSTRSTRATATCARRRVAPRSSARTARSLVTLGRRVARAAARRRRRRASPTTWTTRATSSSRPTRGRRAFATGDVVHLRDHARGAAGARE